MGLDGVLSHDTISWRLYYGSSADDAPSVVSDAEQIDDSNYYSILNNPLGTPVLVDCYTAKCGPCKLIERSLNYVLPKYVDSEDLCFCRWDTDEKENSQQFLELLREKDMTFRKLPTLILFVDGAPVAMRSGMATEGQLNRFLEENLPKKLPSLFVPTLRRRNAGGV